MISCHLVIIRGIKSNIRAKNKKREYLVTPTILPGISRIRGFLHAMNAACGPPYPSGVPNRWLLPTTMSTPNSPGALTRVSDNKSVAHTTNDYNNRYNNVTLLV